MQSEGVLCLLARVITSLVEHSIHTVLKGLLQTQMAVFDGLI